MTLEMNLSTCVVLAHVYQCIPFLDDDCDMRLEAKNKLGSGKLFCQT